MKNSDIEQIIKLNNENLFIIRYQMTSLCNYSCAFCIQGSHEEHLRAAQTESKKKDRRSSTQLFAYLRAR